MKQAKKILVLAIVAASFPAVAFDGGRGIHIALTGNANSPYAAISEASQIAEKVAVAVAAPSKVAVAVPAAKTSFVVAGTGVDY